MPDITEESDATPDEAYELGWLAAMDEAEKVIESMNRQLREVKRYADSADQRIHEVGAWWTKYAPKLERYSDTADAAWALYNILNEKRL